jgi:hypothetical protein
MLIISRLRELVAALDRRRPQPERPGEPEIAADSAKLREEAVTRIAQLEQKEEQEPCR